MHLDKNGKEETKMDRGNINRNSKDIIAVRIFANPIVAARDKIAKVIIKLGISPNILTVAGAVFTLIASYILACGAEEKWSLPTAGKIQIPAPFWAGLWLILASAMDMLDGTVARLGNKKTVFGGILDSTVDRISDLAILGGIGIAFSRQGNLTFLLLSLIAACNAILISYIKARAECEKTIGKLSVGYWQRGERMVGIIVACIFAHIGTLIWLMATLPAFTAARRLWACYMITNGKNLPQGGNPLLFWRFGRNTWQHAIISAIYILILATVDLPTPDIIRTLSSP